MSADLENKKTAMLACIATEQARAAADMTAGFVRATGISVSELSFLDLLKLSANIMRGAMEATSLSRYIPLETRVSDAAGKFAANSPDPEVAADVVKYAAVVDMGTTLLKNFAAGETDLKDIPEPTSLMAKRWAAELSSPLHNLPLRVLSAPAVATVQAEQPDEACLLAIRAKIMIPENEAAVLLGMSSKALSNARRNKKIPRSIYSQSLKGGKIAYNTAALLEWANGKPLGRKAK